MQYSRVLGINDGGPGEEPVEDLGRQERRHHPVDQLDVDLNVLVVLREPDRRLEDVALCSLSDDEDDDLDGEDQERVHKEGDLVPNKVVMFGVVLVALVLTELLLRILQGPVQRQNDNHAHVRGRHNQQLHVEPSTKC